MKHGLAQRVPMIDLPYTGMQLTDDPGILHCMSPKHQGHSMQ